MDLHFKSILGISGRDPPSIACNCPGKTFVIPFKHVWTIDSNAEVSRRHFNIYSVNTYNPVVQLYSCHDIERFIIRFTIYHIRWYVNTISSGRTLTHSDVRGSVLCTTCLCYLQSPYSQDASCIGTGPSACSNHYCKLLFKLYYILP